MGAELQVGGPRRVRPSMNVTPLVDVVLVLLIIFMVVTPLLSKQLWLQLPKQETKNEAEPPKENKSVVLTVKKDGLLEINGAAVHTLQALVLINRSGNCSGRDVYALSEHVLNTVKEKFGVTLEREVNIIA